MAFEDCLEVCFVGLVAERICVWCLVIITIFTGFGQAEVKRCRGGLKSHQLGVVMQLTNGGLFSQGRKIILLYCETLLQILLGIYSKGF